MPKQNPMSGQYEYSKAEIEAARAAGDWQTYYEAVYGINISDPAIAYGFRQGNLRPELQQAIENNPQAKAAVLSVQGVGSGQEYREGGVITTIGGTVVEDTRPKQSAQVLSYTDDQRGLLEQQMMPQERKAQPVPKGGFGSTSPGFTVNPFTKQSMIIRQPKGVTYSTTYDPFTGTVTKELYRKGTLTKETTFYGFPSQTIGGSMTTATTTPTKDTLKTAKAAGEINDLLAPSGGFNIADPTKAIVATGITFVPSLVQSGFEAVKLPFDVIRYGPGIAQAKASRFITDTAKSFSDNPLYSLTAVSSQVLIGGKISSVISTAKLPKVTQKLGMNEVLITSTDEAGNIAGTSASRAITSVGKKVYVSDIKTGFKTQGLNVENTLVMSEGKSAALTTAPKNIFGKSEQFLTEQTTQGLSKGSNLESLTATLAENFKVPKDTGLQLVNELTEASSRTGALTKTVTTITDTGLPKRTVGAGVAVNVEKAKPTSVNIFADVTNIERLNKNPFSNINVRSSGGTSLKPSVKTTAAGIATGQSEAAAAAVKQSIISDLKPSVPTGNIVTGGLVSGLASTQSLKKTNPFTSAGQPQGTTKLASSRTFTQKLAPSIVPKIKQKDKTSTGTITGITQGQTTIVTPKTDIIPDTKTDTITDVTDMTDTRTVPKIAPTTKTTPASPTVPTVPRIPFSEITTPPVSFPEGRGGGSRTGFRISGKQQLKYKPSLGGIFGYAKPISKAPKITSGLGIRPLVKSSKSKKKKIKGFGLF